MGLDNGKLLLILSFFGGLGLILVGLKYLSNSFQTLFGKTIEWLMNSIDHSPIKAVLSGLGVSLLIQSGITTTIMAVSYAGSGLLSLTQMFTFLLGTNLGTVLTPWIFTLDAKVMSFYLLGIGALPMLYCREEKLHALSQFVFSIGLMLLGFHFMDLGILDPLMLRSVLEASFAHVQWNPYMYYFYLVMFFVVCSLIVRSSVAMIAILMLLVHKEVIPDVAGIIGVLGVNFGASLPVIFSTMKSGTRAKRGAFFHVLSQLTALLFITIFFDSFWSMVTDTVNFMDKAFFEYSLQSLRSFLMVPLSHLYFNVILIVVCSVLFFPLKWVVKNSVRGKSKKEPQNLKLLGQIIHASPSLALEQANQEVKKMSAMVETIFQLVHNVIFEKEPVSEKSKIDKYEKITDNIQRELLHFLEKIMELSLVENQGRKIRVFLRITDELECIADNCKLMHDQYKLLVQKNGQFDEDLKKVLKPFFMQVLTFYESVFSELTNEGSDGIEQKQKLFLKSKAIKEQQSKLLAQINQLKKEDEIKLAGTEIVLALGLIRSQAKNIVEAF